MSSRSRVFSATLMVLLSSFGCSSSGSKSTPATSPGRGAIELTQSGACGDAFFWAATRFGDVAVTIAVEARDRSHDDSTTIPIDLPDSTVKARVLRGWDMTGNFCNDVLDSGKSPTSEQDAIVGNGVIHLDPAEASGTSGCDGTTHGTLRLANVKAEDGTGFAPIVVKSDNIGCYAG